MTWHIGNVEAIGEHGLYFRLGRTTRTTVEVFKNGQFLDQDFETAPYTHALIDLDLEVCTIAKKTQAVTSVRQVLRGSWRVCFKPPTAPPRREGHLSSMKSMILGILYSTCAARTRFRDLRSGSLFRIHGDVQEDFLKPAQKLVREANGEQGKTELKGESLNPSVLEDISRSAAATGDDAVAELNRLRTTLTHEYGHVRRGA